MGKKPRASTITNHDTALNRALEYAFDMAYMSRTHIPILKNDGSKSKPRPASSKSEYKSLTSFMTTRCKKGHMQRTNDMR